MSMRTYTHTSGTAAGLRRLRAARWETHSARRCDSYQYSSPARSRNVAPTDSPPSSSRRWFLATWQRVRDTHWHTHAHIRIHTPLHTLTHVSTIDAFTQLAAILLAQVLSSVMAAREGHTLAHKFAYTHIRTLTQMSLPIDALTQHAAIYHSQRASEIVSNCKMSNTSNKATSLGHLHTTVVIRSWIRITYLFGTNGNTV